MALLVVGLQPGEDDTEGQEDKARSNEPELHLLQRGPHGEHQGSLLRVVDLLALVEGTQEHEANQAEDEHEAGQQKHPEANGEGPSVIASRRLRL